jgi:DNA-binding SARP family transcriptional activator
MEIAMLNVALLGGASFSVDSHAARTDLGPAGRLLACYLFQFPGRAHRRERLADLFWGDLEPEKSRSALNTAVWRVRKILDQACKGGGQHLLTLGNGIVMEVAEFIRVDTYALEEASRRVANCSSNPTFSSDDECEIRAAVEAYFGPFLDGDDADWILQERERLHCLFVRTTLELMRMDVRRGEFERALDQGRKILALDPLRESVQRDVMLLLVLNGQRAEAIHTYQQLRAILKRDLGIEPMPDTKRLHHEIHSGDIFHGLDSYSLMHFGNQARSSIDR